MKNKRASGIDTVIAGTLVFILQFYILMFFISAELFFTLEQQIQVEAQQFVNLLTRNEPTTQNLILYNTYFKNELIKYKSFGTFKIEYEILDAKTLDVKWQKSSDDSDEKLIEGYNPNQGDIVKLVVVQQENSTLGNFIRFWIGFDNDIKVKVRKVGAFER